eukprot:CAMPEP_0114538082 /NCGR_PEP_ID=MMETSP0109-20121206/29940_1 /TAXON_ID=29199 /ORGANISM="Chlorarachnion reptans, Strain CCCM449" /LENGTH=385 /DNA_ID=CAMNT_0001722051 /DNA_START=26 /DNA_END=1183 /DNA_ORIENTATION=+
MATLGSSSYHQAPAFPSAPAGPDAKIKITVFRYSDEDDGHNDSKTSYVYIEQGKTVSALKSSVRSQHGCPESTQTAIYKGQVLHDNFVLSSIPGLCGQDGTTAHVRIVLRSDVEGKAKGFERTLQEESNPLLTKGNAPPPGYFQQQSVFRRHSPHTSFDQNTPYFFPREVGEETALIRKVYTALSLQMLFTAGLSAAFMLYQPLNAYVYQNQAVFYYGSMIVGFGTLIGLFCFKAKYPNNLYLLMAFTAAMACQVGVITALYARAGLGEIVLQAFIYTAAIFGALTIYAFTTKIDVRSWGPYLFVGLIAIVIWGFVNMIFGLQAGWIYSLGGALLFSAYILYDTSRLLHTFGSDESWIMFTIDLYLDLINLFLFLLQLLSQNRGD